MKKVQTVSIVRDGNEILLGMKKRGFGEGRWNGFGGKAEKGETPLEAAKRELLEEVGITAIDLAEYGAIIFRFVGSEDIIECHFFLVDKYKGEPVESEEMRPEWFEIKDIPYDVMWPDDRYWLPMMLEGKKFGGKVLFNKSGTMAKNSTREIS